MAFYCGASVIIIVLLLYVCCCLCSPVVYKEDTTTAKLYKDRLLLKKEHETIPINGTTNNRMHNNPVFKFGSRYNFESENPKSKFEVKSVLPGEKTMREGDDDDDDDDDGGEYEGVDSYSMAHPMDVAKGSCWKKPDNLKQDSVPMMIIREVDMVAMEIPVSQKCTGSGGDWSLWSPCSKPCGDGVQTRWRRPGGDGGGQREQQVRRCHLADCDGDAFDEMFP